MTDFEKKFQLAKARADRLKKSARISEELLEQRSRDLYLVNQKLEAAQEHLQSEVKQATYELNVANQRLRKSLKDKSHLIGAISHEIRTPLNAIVGYSELIESEIDEGEVKERVQIISQSAASMMSLLNDILEVTQIEVGNIKIDPVPVDLQDNLAFIDRVFKLQMQEKGLVWEITTDNLPECVRLDIRRYNQIINNLVSNALKYTNAGFVKLHCWFESNPQNPEQGVLFTRVSDSGGGISDDDQAIIFDLYKQISKPVKTSRQDSQRIHQDDVALHSLGLGLPICQTLCQLLLGKISCESELGKGSEFTVNLPVTVAVKEQTDIENEPINPEQQHRKLKILVAEDTLLNQQLIKAQLTQLNQSVEIVDNGLLALGKLEKQDYDLVILDILMPVMDGETTIKKIRTGKQRIAGHFCVALTAASYQEKGQHLLEMGFDEFMSKPITMYSLNELIEKTYARLDLSEQSDKPEQAALFNNDTVNTDWDLSFFREQFGEDADHIFSKIAPTYLEQTRLNQDKLSAALEGQDIAAVQFLAHAMKGEAKTFGFTKLAELCFALEKNEDLNTANHLFTELTPVLNQVLQSLEAHLGEVVSH